MVGAAVEDRAVPSLGRPHRLVIGAGVATVEVSPDGRYVASGVGDGRILLHDLGTGATLGDWRWQDGVVNDVAFDPTGTRLAVATAGGATQRVLEVPSGRPLVDAAGPLLRRVVWLDGGWLLRGVYGRPAELVHGGDTRPLEPAVALADLESDGATAVGIDESHHVWRVRAGEPPRAERLLELRDASTAAPLGEEVVVGVGHHLQVHDATGTRRLLLETGALVLDVAVSADRRWIAAGHIDGSTTVWRAGDGRLLARLPAHGARVMTVAFSRDGAWLVTGGWDGEVRVWSTVEFETAAEDLRRRIESVWGRSLAEVLGRVPS